MGQWPGYDMWVVFINVGGGGAGGYVTKGRLARDVARKIRDFYAVSIYCCVATVINIHTQL